MYSDIVLETAILEIHMEVHITQRHSRELRIGETTADRPTL